MGLFSNSCSKSVVLLTASVVAPVSSLVDAAAWATGGPRLRQNKADQRELLRLTPGSALQVRLGLQRFDDALESPAAGTCQSSAKFPELISIFSYLCLLRGSRAAPVSCQWEGPPFLPGVAGVAPLHSVCLSPRRLDLELWELR